VISAFPCPISSGFYLLPDLLDYRVGPPTGPYDFLSPSTVGLLYLPEPVGFAPVRFFLKPAHIGIAQYVLRVLSRDAYCASCFPSPFPTAYGRCLVSHTRSTVTHSGESFVKVRLAWG
jgi:hypothetical protein